MKIVAFCILNAVFLLAPSLAAQEGHPLVGSWHGDRGTGPKNRTDVTLVVDWDGTQITGVVNPGFEGMPLQNAKLVPKDWSLHFEIESKDRAGKVVRCSVDGKIDRNDATARVGREQPTPRYDDAVRSGECGIRCARGVELDAGEIAFDDLDERPGPRVDHVHTRVRTIREVVTLRRRINPTDVEGRVGSAFA